MESAHAHRKDEHLALAEAEYRQHPPVSSLNDVRIIPNALPEIKVTDVDLTIPSQEFPFTTPFYIEAMTGGSERTGRINQQLATVAKEAGIAMAVGSQSIAMKLPEARASFEIVRQTNPDGFIIGNLGAGHDANDAQMAVEMLEANALEIHLNVAQETVMPEGDREFIWADKLADIIAKVNVPVIVKEVGFGVSQQTIEQLVELGAQYINIGGRSGTNFAIIEDRRQHDRTNKYDFLYDWGLTTAESLLEAQHVAVNPTIFATGGIQSPLDVLKAQVLGAQAVGVAGRFLHTLLNSDTQGLLTEVQTWQTQLAELYAMVGAHNYQELQDVAYVLSPSLLSYEQQRN